MRIALLGPLPWRLSPPRFAAWERVVALLARGLEARGLEVCRFEAEAGEADPDGRRESRLLASLRSRAGEFDLLHNCAGLPPLFCAERLPAPLITTLAERPEAELVALLAEAAPLTHHTAIQATTAATRNADPDRDPPGRSSTPTNRAGPTTLPTRAARLGAVAA